MAQVEADRVLLGRLRAGETTLRWCQPETMLTFDQGCGKRVYLDTRVTGPRVIGPDITIQHVGM